MYSNMNGQSDLSSHSKVLQFLENSSATSRPCAVPDQFHREERFNPSCSRLFRPQSESDDDSLSRSDCSPNSSTESSTTSFPEELDFNLTFERNDDPVSFPLINDTDTILNQSNLNEQTATSEEQLSQSPPETVTCSPQRSLPYLHDSTFTLCSAEHFSPDSDPLHSKPLSKSLSKSLSIVPWHGNGSDLSGKTSKKAVRFADMLGLDLESIRYMTPPDSSSMLLKGFHLSQSPPMPNIIARGHWTASPTSKQYILVSTNYVSPTNILPLIYQKQILLECLYTNESTAYGTIRVHNLAYEKRIFARVTGNQWTSYKDIPAWHSRNSAYDNTDVFIFQINLDRSSDGVEGPKRLLFALCLQGMFQEYWDNNQNANYVLDVFER